MPVYQDDPLKCTFGEANPSFFMPQAQYCSIVAPTELVNEVLNE